MVIALFFKWRLLIKGLQKKKKWWRNKVQRGIRAQMEKNNRD